MFYEGGVCHEGEDLTYKIVRTHKWTDEKRYRTRVGITKARKLKDKWDNEYPDWTTAIHYHRTIR